MMSHSTQFSEYERGYIHASRKDGKTFGEIAKDLNRSAAGVRQFIQRKVSRKRTGRPSIISEKERRLIIRTAADPGLSSEKIRQLCNINATARTVRNVIRRYPYIRRLKLMKRSRLTHHLEEKRLEFSRKNMNRNWDTVRLEVSLVFFIIYF